MAEYKYPGDVRWLTHDSPHILFAELAREQGPVVSLLSKRKLVAINGLETITEVLKEQADKLRRPISLKALQSRTAPKTLEIKDGRLHEEQKAIMLKVINEFVMTRIPENEDHIRQATDLIINEIGTGLPTDPDLPVGAGIMSYVHRVNFGSILTRPQAFEMAREFNTLAFIEAALGGRFRTFREELAPPGWEHVFSREFKVFKQNRNPLYETGEKQIEEHARSFDPDRLRDMADGLLKANHDYRQEGPGNIPLPEEDLLAGSMFQLFGASKGTLTMFVLYALHYLAVYQEIQSAIRKEIDEITAKGMQPGFSCRHEIPPTEACLWEILRHSSVTAIAAFNYETKAQVMAAGRKLDKGTILFINYYSTTRDERHWPDPETFDPRRFLDEDGRIDRNRIDRFLPFGIGRHGCLAGNWAQMAMLTLLATLVARCRFERAPSTPKRLGQHPGVFLVPHNYELIARRRESI
uniref:Cytochrome P450 n=1 Tax=Candidatus Kentrum sp. FW TaxID=2126338 RepID=A0A450RT68_9GAMM|nr:MAG: Cytochrome P450 [Candidatus Kentron sp. FW]